MAMAARSDSSPVQSGRFLERVGETATETLLAPIENHGEESFSGDPELMMHDWGWPHAGEVERMKVLRWPNTRPTNSRCVSLPGGFQKMLSLETLS